MPAALKQLYWNGRYHEEIGKQKWVKFDPKFPCLLQRVKSIILKIKRKRKFYRLGFEPEIEKWT